MEPPNFVKLLHLLPRISQILFCITCLATAAATAHTFGQATPGAVGLALFAAASGLLVSSLLLLADLTSSTRLTRISKGLLDFILALLWAIFFLSAGAAVASYGTCKTTASGIRYIVHAAGGTAGNGAGSSSLLVPAGSIGSGSSSSSSSGGTDPSDLSSSVDMSYDWSTFDWSNTGIYAPGFISDVMNAQHEATMSVINNIGHRRLLRSSSDVEAEATSLSHRRQLLQSIEYKLVCPTWNAVTAMSFILFVLYGISAVLAVLDMRVGKGLFVPVWLHSAAAVRAADGLPVHSSEADDDKPTTAAAAAAAAEPAVVAAVVATDALDAKDTTENSTPAVVVSCEQAALTQQFESQTQQRESQTQDASENHIATTEYSIDSI